MLPETKQNRRYKLTLLAFKIIAILHNIMKGARFADVAVTAVLRSIPKETFADSFQKIYERCQQFVVKDGD
jgi:hypothetical protein